jgi:signal transduction histidine kinase
MDGSGPPYAALLSEIAGELKEALVELRDLARGIHPSLLTDEGVGPAVDSLARRAQVPTRIVQTPAERFSTAVEAAAYFVVAEALTNAARHAEASKVTIDIRNGHKSLHVCIRDDGKGGATLGGGSGLRGIRDRVLSLGGSLHVDSPLGSGTVVTAIIPTWVDAGQ